MYATALHRRTYFRGMIVISALSILSVLQFAHSSLAQAESPGVNVPVPTAADTPAVAVVRQFLAARTAGENDAAYALLSASSQQHISEKQFLNGASLSPSDAQTMPATLFGLVALLGDTHNAFHYTFTIIGADPAAPNVVLIRADPPTGATDIPAATLRLLTVPGPSAGTRRVDAFGSMESAAPGMMVKSKETAQQIASESNLKQLGLGIMMYQQDHNGILPDAAHWVDQVMPYVKNKTVFHDPSAPASQAWSYAFNLAASHKNIALFKNPEATVLLFESSKGVKNASDTGQSVPRPGRHDGGADYGFVDGHVKWFPDGTKLSYKISGK